MNAQEKEGCLGGWVLWECDPWNVGKGEGTCFWQGQEPFSDITAICTFGGAISRLILVPDDNSAEVMYLAAVSPAKAPMASSSMIHRPHARLLPATVSQLVRKIWRSREQASNARAMLAESYQQHRHHTWSFEM